MTNLYRFSGHSGLFFKSLYSSQYIKPLLEKAMAQVSPCLFYSNGSCKIGADVEIGKELKQNGKVFCVGAKIGCRYYTGKFKYLIEKYVKDGKYILAQHIIELFQVYLKYKCPYKVVNTFATERGISSYWKNYGDDFGNMIALPRRVSIKNNEIVSLPYHPLSTEYKDYIDFVTTVFFKLLFPRIIYPLDTENIICQNNSISVLLDVPGDGYTYVICISELDLSEDTIKIIDSFFEVDDFMKRSIVENIRILSRFFKQVFIKLRDKQNNNFIIECSRVIFGVILATLDLRYDLSKCLIIYSESKLIFDEDLFDLSKIYIGMFNVDKAVSVNLDMSYCDVNFASNNIYDLATDYTLDASYEKSKKPNITADYKGQDLLFGAKVSLVGKKTSDLSGKEIAITALPLLWYYSDETTKKYLWSLKKKEEIYIIDIDLNKSEQKINNFGKVVFFKNIIILHVDNVTFPFYIKNCTLNSYKYKTKYQSYHPMLEYYDVDPDFSFLLESKEIFSQNKKESVILLKSLTPGTVILVPDVEKYIGDFKKVVRLKFLFIRGDKLEYISDISNCKSENLFIPSDCDNLEQFKFKDLAKEKVYEKFTKVKFEKDEVKNKFNENETCISLSDLVADQLKQEYYGEITRNLEVDKGIGVVYKQADLKDISYFYFSYLGFKFLLDSLSGKTDIVEEIYDEENEINIRVEEEKKGEVEKFDPKNSAIQKFLRGERPLLSVNDLNVSQKKVKGEGEKGQEAYDFKYLYEKTVRSYVNNIFYEPFKINSLCSNNKGHEWLSLFADSVSDFYISNRLEKAKKPRKQNEPKPPVKVKHNLTHILSVYRGFGIPMCGFNENKLKLNNKYSKGFKKSIFDKLAVSNFECTFNKIFYFYILGISKFIQDYIFFIKYKNVIIPVLKRIPVIVSQVGLPDPEIKYKWKSECTIYTYLCNTDLNPFIKVVDINNPDFFVNPFYIIVHKNYRENKYRNEGTDKDNRMATEDYSFLFTSKWWVKYKKEVTKYGYTKKLDNKNSFLNVYKVLARIGDKLPTEKDIIRGFARGKATLYIELDSITYVYSSYCGDHDFSLGDTTPYLYDRTSDYPLVANNKISPYYTGHYDKNGIGMRKNKPCSRFVGYMWFPFRACEVSRYNEFADYPGVRCVADDKGWVHTRSLRGFNCADLIFKAYNAEDAKFSDFEYLFIDDCFGSINPYRYATSFYSTATLYYNKLESSKGKTEISPTYLPSNSSIPWRFIPILFNGGTSSNYTVISEPRNYAITPISSVSEIVGNYVVLDVTNYNDFVVGDTNITITKDEIPKPGVTRSILYNCLRDIPPILPYNYNKDKYICGYERMRGGDANFIYQSLYPYHHNYPYYSSCGCIYDYKHRGEDAYGPIENTLLPGIVSETSEIKTIIHNSVFLPGIYCNGSAHGMYHLNMQRPLFAYDWLNQDIPVADLGCAGESDKFSPIATRKGIPWIRSSYTFWHDYDLLNRCETDGPTPMKICLNKYHNKKKHTEFIDSIFINENESCCDMKFVVDSAKYNVTNLTSTPLYYHYASSWEKAYDYVFLGASMKTKPVFYGDGALRMFEDYEKLKKAYFIFDKDKKITNVGALPIFGGLGKFFRVCYFSTNYGLVPFSTLSGIKSNISSDDDNYVYKLSGYVNNDAAFINNFRYGYLPEKSLVFITDDFSLFSSIISFTEDDSITLKTLDAVCFRDFALYEEPKNKKDNGYYKYKTGDKIKVSAFDDKEFIASSFAAILIYDKNVSILDKYSYYNEVGLKISIAEPVIDDMGVVIDPFPFGDKVEISYKPLLYIDGYLNCDYITLKIEGLQCYCEINIKVKERPLKMDGFPWMFYVKSDKNVINGEGEVENETVEVQKIYLCYDNSYMPGKLIQKDKVGDMQLSDYDIIQKGDTKYKINRGFYIDFSNMTLSYSVYNVECLLCNLKNYNISSSTDVQDSPYVKLSTDCFIINFEGSVSLSNKFSEPITIGYLCLETFREFYAIGNLVAYPKFDDYNENVKYNGKYRYILKFEAYDNYNKIKYCGIKYRFVFNIPTFFYDIYNDSHIRVKYGEFDGGFLCKIVFNKISSLKAIVYSKNIKNIVQTDVKGINLYHENLNDKLMVDDALFYIMPFGFVYKLGGGISSDKEIKFKNGYNSEFITGLPDVKYNKKEQEVLDKIVLPVEQDVFKLIHYSTSFVRFCLKSKIYNTIFETNVDFDMSLIPDLCNIFGYVPIQQWVAPGHKLDLYPDSFYGKERSTFHAFEDKYFDPGNFITPIGLVGAAQAIATFSTPLYQDNMYSFSKCYIDPHNMLFITHVNHGMFGYPDIVDVSDWIKNPTKPIVYEIYDKDGNKIK